MIPTHTECISVLYASIFVSNIGLKAIFLSKLTNRHRINGQNQGRFPWVGVMSF